MLPSRGVSVIGLLLAMPCEVQSDLVDRLYGSVNVIGGPDIDRGILDAEQRSLEHFWKPSEMNNVSQGMYDMYSFQSLDDVPDGIICNADSLQWFGCQDREKNNWTAFLHQVCTSCWHSGCANSWKHRPKLLEMAHEVLYNINTETFCWTGVIVSVILLLHLTDDYQGRFDKRFLEQQAKALGFDEAPAVLTPFPFEKDSWHWYSNGYRPQQSVFSCEHDWVHAKREPKTLLVFEPPSFEYCSVKVGGHQKLQRCNERSIVNYVYYGTERYRSHTDRPPVDWKCPRLRIEEQWIEDKYAARNCYEPKEAMWQFDLSAPLRCVHDVIAEKLDFQPGDRVLDWGSGCGHFLTWATMLYGIDGYGIDATSSSVAFSESHSHGSYCK